MRNKLDAIIGALLLCVFLASDMAIVVFGYYSGAFLIAVIGVGILFVSPAAIFVFGPSVVYFVSDLIEYLFRDKSLDGNEFFSREYLNLSKSNKVFMKQREKEIKKLKKQNQSSRYRI